MKDFLVLIYVKKNKKLKEYVKIN